MIPDVLTIATWNTEWRAPHSSDAALLRQRLQEIAPEIICLTEAYTGFLDWEGHVIEAEADYGYAVFRGRRKVLLWSRNPWEEVDTVGHPALPPGRFVSGRTRSSQGTLRVIGVCIPWKDAHVRTGRRDREPWEEHLEYLTWLKEILKHSKEPTIILGDFNQFVPRRSAPVAAYDKLLDALGEDLLLCTGGAIQPDGQRAIDHIAHTADLQSLEIFSVSNMKPGGELISDHFGVAARLKLTNVALQ